MSRSALVARALEDVERLAGELEARGARGAELAIVLGSGLGGADGQGGAAGWSALFQERVVIRGEELPHLPRSSVRGHAGRIVLGRIGSARVLVQEGRVHLYEGKTPFEITRSVRAYARLGVRGLLLTNAAGGLVREWRPGTFARIRDHLNLQGKTALLADEAARGNPYDRRLADALQRAASRERIELESGVYAGMLGPAYETPAEIRALRVLGADLVGMSTVAEASAACAAGMRVAGLSMVANHAAGIGGPLAHEEVLDVARASAERFARLLASAVRALCDELRGARS